VSGRQNLFLGTSQDYELGKKEKNPLEEVINVLPPSRKFDDLANKPSHSETSRNRERETPRKLVEGLETPVPKDMPNRHQLFGHGLEPPVSAMKGTSITHNSCILCADS
jgi:hypothetical protein